MQLAHGTRRVQDARVVDCAAELEQLVAGQFARDLAAKRLGQSLLERSELIVRRAELDRWREPLLAAGNETRSRGLPIPRPASTPTSTKTRSV
jgi:hypothetical protein